MKPMPETIKELYRDKEKLEKRKLLYAMEFENKLRDNRIVTTVQEQNDLFTIHGYYDLEQLNLKKAIEVYNRELDNKELAIWREFENLLKLVSGFSVLLDEEDLDKLLPKTVGITHKKMIESNYAVLPN